MGRPGRRLRAGPQARRRRHRGQKLRARGRRTRPLDGLEGTPARRSPRPRPSPIPRRFRRPLMSPGRAGRAAPIRFGTDGWRAIIAEDFTFANVARVTQATAEFWRRPARPPNSGRVVIGYDRRFLSDQFARVAAEVFLGNGYQVVLTHAPTPTPAVSYAVKKLGAVGGVMITASHNPPTFNGFKLKASFGGPASPADCAAVEQLVDRHPVQRTALETAGRSRCAVRDLIRPHL